MEHIGNSIREMQALYNLSMSEERLLVRAAKLLEDKLRNPKDFRALVNPNAVRMAAKSYFTLTHAGKEHEVFSIMFLDNQNRLITIVDNAIGTIDEASVHSREVVKQALQHNAAAVILTHNHPSGAAEPSRADRCITERLTNALELIGVRLLDHIIIGHMDSFSFAEAGLI